MLATKIERAERVAVKACLTAVPVDDLYPPPGLAPFSWDGEDELRRLHVRRYHERAAETDVPCPSNLGWRQL